MRVFKFALALLLSTSANAAPITFAFTGKVIVESHPTIEMFMPMIGTYTFESTTPNTGSAPFEGIYQGAILSVSASVPDAAFSILLTTSPGGSSVISVLDKTLGAFTDSYSGQAATAAGDHFLFVMMESPFSDESLISGVGLPVVPPSRSVVSSETWQLSGPTIGGGFEFEIDSLTLVPEPASGLLLGVGVTALLACRRAGRRVN